MNGKTKGIIIFIGVFVILAGMMTGLIFYAKNFVAAMKLPEMGLASMDIDGVELDEKYSALILMGQWEFYYNKWIITDNLDTEPDGLIDVPSRWSGKIFNGVKLPREGYASYKMTVHNAKEGEQFAVSVGLLPCAYRVFINGELNTVSGQMSKDISGSIAADNPEEVYFYTVDSDEDLEIVLELSANSNGGLIFWPVLNSRYQYERIFVGNSWFGKLIFYISLGIMFPVIIVVTILNFLHIYKQKNYSIILFIFSMIIWYCSSIDVFFKISKTFNIDYGLINILVYISGFLMYLSFLYVLYKHDIIGGINLKRALIFIGANIIAMILYFATYGYNFMYAFLSIPAVTMLYYIYKICLSISNRQKIFCSVPCNGYFYIYDSRVGSGG